MQSESSIRRVVLWTCAAILAIGAVRLFDVMLLRGTSFRAVADDNRLFEQYTEAPRGVFFDRNGTQLVYNAPQFFALTEESSTLLYPKRERSLSASEAAQLAIDNPARVEKQFVRSYVFAPALSHLIGYTGFADPDPLGGKQDNRRTGKVGLEKVFETTLAGSPGIETYEMLATGKRLRVARDIPPRFGQDAQLTIDANLSMKAFAAFGDKTGAAVVSDIETGQLLTIISAPSYSAASISSALTDTRKPLINRALTSYPPGSTFKIVTALAALETGKMTADSIVVDEGQIKVGEQIFGNWYFRQFGRTEGPVNVVKALARSNDIYFYKAAESIGPTTLAQYATLFGLGRTSGIGFIEEKKGLVPDPAWKERAIGTKWFLGDTYHYGIGQGFVLASPLQINEMTAAVARGGEWCAVVIDHGKRAQCEMTDVGKESIQTVVDGMVAACSTGGTAFPFFPDNENLSDNEKVACKTGTAEFGQSDDKGHKKTHGWLTMFYPREKPKVAITVFVESTDALPFVEGSKDAGPIAHTIWQAWREGYER